MKRPAKALKEARAADATGFHDLAMDAGIARVSVVGMGMGMRFLAGVVASVFEALRDEGIDINTGVLIGRHYVEVAAQALNDGFGPETGPGACPAGPVHPFPGSACALLARRRRQGRPLRQGSYRSLWTRMQRVRRTAMAMNRGRSIHTRMF